MLPEQQQAQATIERIQTDPAWFVREVLGGIPWLKQIEIIEAIRDHKEVAVKSCHGAGKDWISAAITIWFSIAHDPVVVLTTGPTDRQVKDILWKEIAVAYSKAKFPIGGRLLGQELRLTKDRWAIGFTTTDDPSRFQGFHAENVLVIIDEASGVKPLTYTAIDGILTSANARKLEIGNPTDPSSTFAKSFKTPGIHKISITAFDTPNFTAFGITLDDIRDNTWQSKITGDLPYPALITPEWVYKRFVRWGENNPFFQSRVLARFPSAGPDTLITMAQVEDAQARTLPITRQNVLSIDVARQGDDYTVIYQRRGQVFRLVDRFNKSPTTETTGRAIKAKRNTGASHFVVDGDGLGAGVVDELREAGHIVIEFHGGATARDDTQFENQRAECFWVLRQDCERGDIDLDAEDENAAAQLADIKWKISSRGRTLIEDKATMKKRCGHSPDEADAIMMSYSTGSISAVIETPSDHEIHSHLFKKPPSIGWKHG